MWPYLGMLITVLIVLGAIIYRQDIVRIPSSEISNLLTLGNKNTIPPDLLQKINDYLIDEVGKDYFETNFKYLPKKTMESGNPNDGIKEWTVYFEFKPLTRIRSNQDVISFQAYEPSGNVREEFVVYKDGDKIVEPKITRDEAFEILRAKNYEIASADELYLKSPSIFNNFKNWTWAGYITLSSSDSECRSGYEVYVDTATGQVFAGGTGESCY